jgi:hypothetical protein
VLLIFADTGVVMKKRRAMVNEAPGLLVPAYYQLN